jgi:glycosyltransferase involved in cell wall biosynthesis
MIISSRMSKPLVSVIAVSYNHEKWVTECFESIRNQTLNEFELIYADDASKDGTVSRALDWLDQHYPNTKRIIHHTNRGLCATLNEALSWAEGTFVQLLACDDRLEIDKFEKQVRYLSKAPDNIGFTFGNFGVLDCEGRIVKEIAYLPKAQPPEDILAQVLDPKPGAPSICMLTALFRKAVLDRVFPLDQALSFEGIQIWTKVLSCGTQGRYFPERLGWYRVVPESLSHHIGSRRRVYEDVFAYIEALLREPSLSPWFLPLRRRLERTLYLLLADAARQRDEQRFGIWFEKYKAHFGDTPKSLCRLLLNLDGDAATTRWLLRCSPIAQEPNHWVWPVFRMSRALARIFTWTKRQVIGRIC